MGFLSLLLPGCWYAHILLLFDENERAVTPQTYYSTTNLLKHSASLQVKNVKIAGGYVCSTENIFSLSIPYLFPPYSLKFPENPQPHRGHYRSAPY